MSVIPHELLSPGDIHNIQKIITGSDSIMRLLELTERKNIECLKKEREIPLY
jgi:hypothetical protein